MKDNYKSVKLDQAMHFRQTVNDLKLMRIDQQMKPQTFPMRSKNNNKSPNYKLTPNKLLPNNSHKCIQLVI